MEERTWEYLEVIPLDIQLRELLMGEGEGAGELNPRLKYQKSQWEAMTVQMTKEKELSSDRTNEKLISSADQWEAS